MESPLYPQGSGGVKSRYVDGVLTFYDTSGNIIYQIDPANRKVTFPSGSVADFVSGTLKLDGTAVTATAAEINALSDAELVAATGNSQGTAAALGYDTNLVTGADNTTGVILPTAVAGRSVRVVNTVANKTLPVYPASGAQINALGANNAFTIGPGRSVVFAASSTTLWYADTIATATPTTTELALLAGAGTGGTPVASKVQVADANQNIGAVKATALHIGTSGAEVQVTATPAELNLNASVTAGSITASKTVTRTSVQGIPLATAVLSAAGANASNGTALTKDVNLVTGADNTTCVVLPVGVAGESITVVNTVADKVLPVFPNGAEQINGGGAGVVFTMGPARVATFYCTAASTWYVAPAAAATATVAQQNFVSGVTAGASAASKAVVLGADSKIDTLDITTPKINGTAVTATAAELNALASAASGLGSSNSYVNTDSGVKTLVAANATKNRGVLVVVTINETYAVGGGTEPTLKIGETDTDDKCAATAVFTGATAGTRFVFGFSNLATKAIIATLTAKVGGGTGGCSILVLALPNS